jgi:PAS domain S-box-containing protein
MPQTDESKTRDLKKEVRALRRRNARLEALQVRRAEEHLGLKKVVDRLQQGVTIKDMEGRILYSNPAEARMHGYTRKELMGQEGRILGMPGDGHSMTRVQVKKMSSWKRERINVRKDGSTFPVQILSDVIHGNGKPIEIITTCTDITERRRIEEILRKSVADNRAILNAVPDPLFHIAGDRTFLSCRAQSEEDLALPPRLFLNRKVTDVYPPDLARLTMEVIRKTLAEGITQSFEYQIAVPLPHGEPRDYECRMVVYGENEVLAVLRDITLRKGSEAALKLSYERLHRTLGETVHALATTVEKRDPYTAGHMVRSTQLACAITADLGLSGSQIGGLRIAGLLHDIGKITIPAEILAKPGPLSEGGLILIRSHSQVGYDILGKIDFPWPVAATVLQHHERLDGSGYPSGLTGDRILPEARILAVADVVEAMTSHRPYRPTRGREIALEEVARQKGILYDSAACEACRVLFQQKAFDFEF